MTDMQVVILCGGQGTRIRDIADDIPKPMIPIGDRPILWHVMNCYAQYGFRRFILCLGFKSYIIKRYFMDYHWAAADLTLRLSDPSELVIRGGAPREDWEITLVETGLQSMTGCRVARITKYIDTPCFALTYGDSLSDIDLRTELAFHERHGRMGTVSAVRVPGRFGEMQLENSRVTEFNEKPPFTAGRINGGFFIFQRAFLNRLHDDEGLVLEREPLSQLARDGELMGYKHDGFWYPMDNSRDFHHLNSLWSQGRAPWCSAAQTPDRLAA
jgi:glucose-1-phosphate cytidylyltransferase